MYFYHQGINKGETSGDTSCRTSSEDEGMSDKNQSSVEVVVLNEGKIDSEGTSLQMVTDEAIAMDVIEEVVSKDNVSMPEGKRKNVGEEEIEVSTTCSN